jgi:plastocyanin
MEIYFKSIMLAIVILGLGSIFLDISSPIAFAQTNAVDANNIIQNKSLTLPPNVKHLVILIPNEGHHGPNEGDESRFIAQPFVPQNAIIGAGTQVVWFSGDVGHDHNIVVREANSTIFETGQFPEFGVTRPITFNNSGTFDYADTVDYEEGFRMTGKISVLADNGQLSNVAARTTTNNTAADTVGVLMVPAEDSQDIVQSLRTAGFGIDSMTTFRDLRTAQEENGGDQQALLVWTTGGKTMNEITSTLQQVSDELPYG